MDTPVIHNGREYVFIDTAGLRRKNKVKEADVRALNPQIKDFSKLQIGDKIRLRASSSAPAAGAAAPAKVSGTAEVPVAPIAPIQIGAQVTEETPAAPVENAPAPPAPEVKPAQLSPALNFNTLPMNPTDTPTANPGTATAE